MKGGITKEKRKEGRTKGNMKIIKGRATLQRELERERIFFTKDLATVSYTHLTLPTIYSV